MLSEGQVAPDFSLFDSNGEKISLSHFAGKRIILYFYPRDNTSGCTKEAVSFKEAYDAIWGLGTVIIGISPDSVSSHQKFKEKYELPFILLSDPEKEAAKLYGAWGEKTMYGKKTMGIIRSTFIIDSNGKIAKVFPKVKADGHGFEVLDYLKNNR